MARAVGNGGQRGLCSFANRNRRPCIGKKVIGEINRYNFLYQATIIVLHPYRVWVRGQTGKQGRRLEIDPVNTIQVWGGPILCVKANRAICTEAGSWGRLHSTE